MSTSGSTARSTCNARRRATRCWCRPAPARTARTSRPGTPRPSSPPSRPWRRRRPSTRTSSSAREAIGRNPDGIKILPGIVPVIGDTEAEARALDAELERADRPRVRQAAARPAAEDRPRRPRPRRAAARGPPHRGRDRGREEPLHAHRGARPAREADRTPADRAARRRARTPHLRRHARAGRRHHRALVRQRRRRRLQHHARRAPVRPGGLRRPGGADPAGTRPVPHRVHRAARCATTTGCRGPPTGCSRPSTAARATSASVWRRSGDGLYEPGNRYAPAAAARLGAAAAGLLSAPPHRPAPRLRRRR